MERVPHDPGIPEEKALNLAGFLPRSSVNGPGIRAVVWVQGCPIRCKGCFNRQLWSFSHGEVVPVNTLLERILAIPDIDGVTFSGGEPFTQAGALSLLGEGLKDAGLSLVTYTGYTYDQLVARKRSSWQRLLSVTDLLVAGPYVSALICSEPFIGSGNQSVIRLSNRIPATAAEADHGTSIEFTIAPDGTLTATGFPDRQMVRVLTGNRGGA